MKRFALVLACASFLIASTAPAEVTSMSSFEKAISVVLEHEGGFVNDRHDPGGATNWGVSLRRLLKEDDHLKYDYDGDGDVDADDMRQMPRDDAIAFYQAEWWDRYSYGLLEPQSVATKVFDMAVNMGPRQAHKLLQLALTSAQQRVTVDGVIGPQTRAAVEGVADRDLIQRRPNLARYRNGWTARALS